MNKLLSKLRGFTPIEEMLFDLNLAFKRENGKTVVLGDVYLSGRGLKQLPDFSSVEVRGSFYCNNNLLKSLEGAPRKVTGAFECQDNFLTTLEGCPKSFRSMTTDFGVYRKWADIPQNLQLTDETRARAFNEGATVLEEKIRIKKPLAFRLKPR